MERAPLPPHERAWRHPSELAAADREALSAEQPIGTSRAIALVGGAAGMLAVALLVLTLAPRRTEAPVAVSSTSSPEAPASPQLTAPVSLGRDVAGLVVRPLATPIGNEGLALTTSRALVEIADLAERPIDVELVTGHIASALVVDPGENGGIAWVAVDSGEFDHGLDVASDMPHADDIVTVLANPPMIVEFAQIEAIDAADVADGTPVVDDDGDVVGLCIQPDEGGNAGFIPIDELVGAATTDARD
ncbi:MAG: hypothetical protein ACRDZZ_12360 [Ilumatobacteraceae bacterium]